MRLRSRVIAPGLFVALCACTARKGTDDAPVQESAHAKLADEPAVVHDPDPLAGWAAETFALPPGFSPELPTGHESLRFAPGWRDPNAEDFWSYAFVMWIDEPAPDEARMKELLERYYDGLLSSFAAGQKGDISSTPARVEVVRTATNYFEVKMRVIDAFATFEPIDLRVVVDSYAETDDRAVLHIQVSPRPSAHAIWRSLEVAIARIVSEDGALRKQDGAKVADPMASFERMVGGAWKRTARSGTGLLDTWHWGPGKHSIRVMTDGIAANGDTWRELQVFYWHPVRKQVCLLGLSRFAAGVSAGSITFGEETAEAEFDLRSGATRRTGLRWTFEGPDTYRATLRDATGGDGSTRSDGPLEYTRTRTPATKAVRDAAGAQGIPERLKIFEPLLGRTWGTRGEAKGSWSSGGPFHVETTFEWVPLANAVYTRTFALRGNGTPIHLIDAYVYLDSGTDRLRCLALSSAEGGRGRVYEGDLTVVDGGAIQLDLKGYEGQRVVPYVVRFDLEGNRTLRQRAWSVDGTQRTPVLDVLHTASQMTQNIVVVFQDKKGDYWFGSWVEGVYRHDGHTLTHFTTKDGLPDDGVGGIQEDTAGNLYFTTSNGIGKFDGTTFSTLIPVRSDPPDKEWKLEPGDLWFLGTQGAGSVCRYDGKVLHGLDFPTTKLGDEHYAQYPRSQYPRMRFSPYDIYSIYEDSQGHLWFGTGTGLGSLGACRYDGRSFAWISSDELGFGDIAYCVRSIIEDKDGRFWFSNTKNRYDVREDDSGGQGRAVEFRKEPGVSHSEDGFPFFMSSTRDADGDLWMASFGAGVWRYDGRTMTQYPVQEGGRPVTLFSIYKDRRGVLWLGSHEAGPFRFNGTAFEQFQPWRD